MKFGAMLSDILSSLFKRPATQQYPFVRLEAPERYRGRMVWDPTKCSGCMLCTKDCPSDAIEILVIDRVNKRFVMRYHAEKCTYCSQCVVNCRFKCIEMSNEQWENASTKKEPFVVYYGRDEDVQSILGKDIQRGSNVQTG